PQPDFLAGRLAPDIADRTLKPEREQHACAVSRNLHAGAELGEFVRLLVDIDVTPGTQQRQCGCQPADSGADDQDAQCFLRAKANDITTACDPDCNRSLLHAPPSRGMTQW